jgi:uncharacterized membrane protein
MEIKLFYTILHLLGVAIGCGGAFMSDVMFMTSVKDNRINHTEYLFLKTGSTFVWIGLGILLISGLLLFSTDPNTYMQSDKFLSKMTIVGLLAINGLFFHKWHMPTIRKHKDQEFNSLKHFKKARAWLVISGVISMTSWTFALVLGAWRGIPFSYWQIMGVYATAVIIGSLLGRIIFKKKFSL